MLSQRDLRAARSFLGKYDAAVIPVQRLVQGSLADFFARLEQLGPAVFEEYDTYSSLQPAARTVGLNSVRKLDVAGGLRMLMGVGAGALTLLDFGKHDIEKVWDRIRNKKAWLSEKLATAEAAEYLANANENPFLSLAPSEGWAPYFAGESTEEWLYFLDGEQYEVACGLASQIEDHLLGGEGQLGRLVLGGPGTGKTIVLLKLLQKVLTDGFTAGLVCSDAVYDYLSTASGSRIPRVDLADAQVLPDVLLVDDPSSLRAIRSVFHQSTAAVVAAFDPLQLDQLPTTAELGELFRDVDPEPLVLTSCYRQRKALAARVVTMTEVLAHSNPFGRADKVGDFEETYGAVLRQFNSLEFRYPEGYFREFQSSDPELTKYFSTIISDKRLWKHVPAILIVFDSDAYRSPPSDILARFPRERVRVLSSDQVEEIKGVDFQHACILISQATLDALQRPFNKSGVREYHRRRLFRIPMSRARDSLALVIVRGEVPSPGRR